VLLSAPESVVLARLAGRRTCIQCGSIYNDLSKPASYDSRCDVCGGALEQRSDDAPAVQEKRLRIYARETAPVLAYYRSTGRLQEIDAQPPVDDVTATLMAEVKTGRDGTVSQSVQTGVAPVPGAETGSRNMR